MEFNGIHRPCFEGAPTTGTAACGADLTHAGSAAGCRANADDTLPGIPIAPYPGVILAALVVAGTLAAWSLL